MTTKRRASSKLSLRQVGQLGDTACDEDGVDVSVGVEDYIVKPDPYHAPTATI